MAKRSKFFCIAVEGATCDGRTLDANALQEMADTYAPATYTARVNMEHIRGFSAEPPFNAYGDVVALEIRTIDMALGGQTEKKKALFAQVDALDNLVAIQAKGQKLYSSIELNPNFAGTGKAYLQGLAVTDSPASLGTEIMAFAAGQVSAGKPSPFADRKLEPGNNFSAAREIEGLEFTEQKPDEVGELVTEAKGFFASMKTFFAQGQQAQTPPAEQQASSQQPTGSSDQPGTPGDVGMAAFAQNVAQGLEKLTGVIEKHASENAARFAANEKQVSDLAASIENTEAPAKHRGRAPGGNTTDLSAFC